MQTLNVPWFDTAAMTLSMPSITQICLKAQGNNGLSLVGLFFYKALHYGAVYFYKIDAW